MPASGISRRLLLGGTAALTATSAAAQHGWSWTVEEQSELTGRWIGFLQ